jgi:hypothetical protein
MIRIIIVVVVVVVEVVVETRRRRRREDFLDGLIALFFPPNGEINQTSNDGHKKSAQKDSTNKGTSIETTVRRYITNMLD